MSTHSIKPKPTRNLNFIEIIVGKWFKYYDERFRITPATVGLLRASLDHAKHQIGVVCCFLGRNNKECENKPWNRWTPIEKLIKYDTEHWKHTHKTIKKNFYHWD